MTPLAFGAPLVASVPSRACLSCFKYSVLGNADCNIAAAPCTLCYLSEWSITNIALLWKYTWGASRVSKVQHIGLLALLRLWLRFCSLSAAAAAVVVAAAVWFYRVRCSSFSQSLLESLTPLGVVPLMLSD